MKHLSLKRQIAIILNPIVIVGFMIIFSKFFINDDTVLSNAVVIDLTLTIPLIHLLLIWNTNISKLSIVPLFVLGLVISSLVIPQEQQSLLSFMIQYVLPLVELFVVSFVIFKIRKIRKALKETKSSNFDFYTQLKEAVKYDVPEILLVPFCTEIAVFHYGFFNFHRARLNEGEFSIHKNTGGNIILYGFLMIILIELFVLHILLVQWSPILAWCLSFLSLYSAFQLFGVIRSIPHRPVLLNDEGVTLRYGIINELNLEWKDVKRVVIKPKESELEKTTYLSVLGEMEDVNVLFVLNETKVMRGFYGIKRKVDKIAFNIDDLDQFEHLSKGYY